MHGPFTYVCILFHLNSILSYKLAQRGKPKHHILQCTWCFLHLLCSIRTKIVESRAAVMATSSSTSLLLMTVLLVATIASFTAEASVCSQVNVVSGECMPYVMDKASSVASACCSAVNGLVPLLNTATNKEQACKCFKTISSNMPGVDFSRVKNVPSECGIKNFPLPLDPNSSC
ncbi:hypothetical protein Droror1_Dr00004814 [Drosera rotundifolia]